MKTVHSRMNMSALALALALCAIGAAAPGESLAQTAPTLQLPIEVLGDGNAVAREAYLHLAPKDLGSVRYLAVTCHRCTFLGAPEFEKTSAPARNIKTAVRILGTRTNAVGTDVVPWIDISDRSLQNKKLELPAAERLQGGLGNTGLYTIRFRIPVDAATAARLTAGPEGNRIRFHFYGTDGESNGFRIIKLNFQDASGRNLIPDTRMQYADIKLEKNKPLNSADVAAGARLWAQGGILRKSNIVPNRILNASCASCHAGGARDLTYFNYSDNSIVQRSRFHGLSDQQARQVLAYVRSNPTRSVHIPQAAPWNPPYQPGPGQDKRPLREWAAGAGLKRVLDTPEQTVNALFGQAPFGKQVSVTQQMVYDLMDPSGSKAPSTRETAISLQFPDWNAWLPSISPEDVWPDSRAAGDGQHFKGSFNQGLATSGNSRGKDFVTHPLKVMRDLDAKLASLKVVVKKTPDGDWADWSGLAPEDRKSLARDLKNVGWQGPYFLGGGRTHRVRNDGRKWATQIGADYLFTLVDPALKEKPGTSYNAMIERATLSMMHWQSVQQWDLVQKYRLDGDQRVFIDRDGGDPKAPFVGIGEKRGWGLNTAGLFFVAPHLAYQEYETPDLERARGAMLHWEDSRVGSFYRTNLWYDLAMVVNPGARDQFSNYPIDWPYHTEYSKQLSEVLFKSATELAKKGDAQSKLDSADAMELSLTHQLREFQVKAKLGQQGFNAKLLRNDAYDTTRDPDNRSRSAAITQLTPAIWLLGRKIGEDSRFKRLDGIQPGLFKLMVGGSFYQFNQLLGGKSGRSAAQWRRCDPNLVVIGRRTEPYHFGMPAKHCIDPMRPTMRVVDKTATNKNGTPGFPFDYETTGETLLLSYESGRALGVAADQLSVFKTWMDGLWGGTSTAADMAVTAYDAPASAAIGQTVTVSYTCRNNGNLGYQADSNAPNAFCRLADLGKIGGQTVVGSTTQCNRTNMNTQLGAGAEIKCTTTFPFRPENAAKDFKLAVLANSKAFDPEPRNGLQSITIKVK